MRCRKVGGGGGRLGGVDWVFWFNMLERQHFAALWWLSKTRMANKWALVKWPINQSNCDGEGDGEGEGKWQPNWANSLADWDFVLLTPLQLSLDLMPHELLQNVTAN